MSASRRRRRGADRARRAALGLEAGLVLVWASLVVRLSSDADVSRRLGEPSEPEPRSARPSGQARRVGRAVSRVAGWLPWRPTCLPQALAVQAMLHRRRIPCESHLGVVGTAPFKAHAWVTVSGTPVVGGPVHHATRLATFTRHTERTPMAVPRRSRRGSPSVAGRRRSRGVELSGRRGSR